ncbi:MAG: cupin domain-containing protein [Deltaproteobacteria bacterium]|nr:cupin domain-containing protein [Deltaproteobacteria bacterium]
MKNYEKIIKTLELEPHPEGGYFKETYRSDLRIPKEGLPNFYKSSKCTSTAIYFLLTKEQPKSFLHKLKSDEIFHLYDGGSLDVLLLYPNGDGTIQTLGRDLEKGERPQVLIPHGTWFGALLNKSASYALIGCTVAPGFEFEDFTLEVPKDLKAKYFDFSEMIEALSFRK